MDRGPAPIWSYPQVGVRGQPRGGSSKTQLVNDKMLKLEMKHQLCINDKLENLA